MSNPKFPNPPTPSPKRGLGGLSLRADNLHLRTCL